MSQCCVIRLDDIAIHCVTRSGDKGAPEKLFSGDREVLKLPDDMPVLHAEFSDYYYASERCQHLPGKFLITRAITDLQCFSSSKQYARPVEPGSNIFGLQDFALDQLRLFGRVQRIGTKSVYHPIP